MNDSTYSDKKGLYQGKRRVVYEDGDSELISYKDDKKHGATYFFNKEGWLIKRGHFRYDKPFGDWIEYYSSGQPKKYNFRIPKGITYQRTHRKDGSIDVDRGHPLIFNLFKDSDLRLTDNIVLAIPPSTYINVLEFKPQDSSIVQEVAHTDGVINYSEIKNSIINNVIYLKWELRDIKTDTLQREDFGKFERW